MAVCVTHRGTAPRAPPAFAHPSLEALHGLLEARRAHFLRTFEVSVLRALPKLRCSGQDGLLLAGPEHSPEPPAEAASSRGCSRTAGARG